MERSEPSVGDALYVLRCTLPPSAGGPDGGELRPLIRPLQEGGTSSNGCRRSSSPCYGSGTTDTLARDPREVRLGH